MAQWHCSSAFSAGGAGQSSQGGVCDVLHLTRARLLAGRGGLPPLCSPSAPSCSAGALQCWATDSFLPRRGNLPCCETLPNLQRILLPCCSLALCSGSVISLFLLLVFLRILLAVGPPVPWGHPPCPWQGARAFRGCFLLLQGEALQKDPVNFCILSPQGLAGVALLWSPAAPVLLLAQDMPQGTPSPCHSPTCPVATHDATHNW